jgi:hypothetical protein
MFAAYYAAAVTEADVIRWAGVASGVAGSAVSAQDGVLLVIGQVAGFVLAAWRQATGKAPRAGRIRPGKDTAPPPAAGTAGGPAAGLPGNGPGTAGQDDAAAHAGQIQQQLAQIREETETDEAALTTWLGQQAAAWQAGRQKVMSRVQQQRYQAAAVNARGLPLIGVGLLLSGIPDGLAALGWFGWAVAGLGWALTGWALWSLGRATASLLAKISSG